MMKDTSNENQPTQNLKASTHICDGGSLKTCPGTNLNSQNQVWVLNGMIERQSAFDFLSFHITGMECVIENLA